MSTLPWAKWFWSDWESDAPLRMCSLAAQGLWMRMLCVAAQHDPMGYVAVNGIGCTVEDIGKLGGVLPEEAARLLGELEIRGVFSRNWKGTIYNRRMIRDAKKSKKARENGKKGGNPSLSKDSEIPASDNLEDKGEDNTQSLEARSQKLDKKESLPSGDVQTDPGGSMILVEGEAEAVVEAEGTTLPVLVIETTNLPVVRLDQTDEVEGVELWNEMARRSGLTQVQKFTTKRRMRLKKRLQDCAGIPGWKLALAKVEASAFLRGEHNSPKHPNWRADFDFITREDIFVKLMEDGYSGSKGPSHADQLDEAFRKIAGEADGYSGFSLTAR